MKRISNRFKTRVKTARDGENGSTGVADATVILNSTKLLQEPRRNRGETADSANSADSPAARSQSPMARLSSNLRSHQPGNSDKLSPAPILESSRKSRNKPKVKSQNPLFEATAAASSRLSSRLSSRNLSFKASSQSKVQLQTKPAEPEPTGPPTEAKTTKSKLRTTNPLFDDTTVVETSQRTSRKFGVGIPAVGFSLPSVPGRSSTRSSKTGKKNKSSSSKSGKKSSSKSGKGRKDKVHSSKSEESKKPASSSLQTSSKNVDQVIEKVPALQKSAPPPVVETKVQESAVVKKYQHSYRINDSASSYYYSDVKKPRRRLKAYVGETLVADYRG